MQMETLPCFLPTDFQALPGTASSSKQTMLLMLTPIQSITQTNNTKSDQRIGYVTAAAAPSDVMSLGT